MKVRALVLVATIAMTGSAFAATAYAVDAETFYLSNDGVPIASLQERPPGSGDLTNFDPGRDISPGLLLQRSMNGVQETDDARFQHWQTDVGSLTLSGVPTLVLWASLKDFDPTKVGGFTAYLLDCPAWGSDCMALAASDYTFRMRPTDTWVEATVSFPEIDYEISEDRALGIRIVVSKDSEDDLLFAYDRINYRSRLVFAAEPLVATVIREVQELAPIEDPVPALTATVTDLPVAIVIEPPESSSGDKELGSAWGWLISLGVSTLMLGALALVLVETLSSRGDLRAATNRWGWLASVRAR